MTLYIVKGISFKNHTPTIVADLLACPTLTQIVFPARLLRAEKQDVGLATPQAFDVRQAVEDQLNELFVRLTFNGENGTQFTATINLDETTLGHVFNLLFSINHLQQGVVTYSGLKAIIKEVVPVFQCDHACVYPVVHGPQVQYFLGPGKTRYQIRLGWMTYFGEELVRFLTPERFNGLKAYKREELDLPGGILVSLSDEPFDPDNPEHWEREATAISELGLDQLKRLH